MASLTPIKGSFHYDDLEGKWRLKASRQNIDGTGAYFEEFIETATSFLQLLQILYTFWAMLADEASTDKRNSPVEDFTAFMVWLGTQTPMTSLMVAPPAGVAVPDPPDYEGYTPYAGGEDDWGVTPP